MRIGTQMSLTQRRILTSNQGSARTGEELTKKLTTNRQGSSSVTLSDSLQKMRNEIKAGNSANEQTSSAGAASASNLPATAKGLREMMDQKRADAEAEIQDLNQKMDSAAISYTPKDSRIRDVDMAKEMLEYTKQNILTQAHTAMMAQAPKLPEGVLQLLR